MRAFTIVHIHVGVESFHKDLENIPMVTSQEKKKKSDSPPSKHQLPKAPQRDWDIRSPSALYGETLN